MGLVAFLVLGAIARADGAPDSPSVDPAASMHIVLPAELIAAAGLESNIYFENVVLALNPANFAFDAVCSKGRQQAERWTWTPTENDIGEFPLQLEVRDERNKLVARAQTTIKVASAKRDPTRVKSLLLIGDSLTHTSVYSQHLLDLSSKFGQPQLILVGSHGLKPELGANRHEGYGGWTAQRFATHYNENARQGDYTKRGSPFLYKQPDGTVKLDFSQYCKDVCEGRFPDAVTIFLGPNDIFSFNDETIAGGIETMLTHYDKLIEMVRLASPSTRLGLMLPVPPAGSQDAFGSNYASSQTRWQYRRNQHALVEAMMKRYGPRRDEGIQLIPTHTNLDCVHNYPSGVEAPNAHSDQKVVRQNNGVHPSAAGYRQIGDTVFAWLNSLP